MSAMMGGVLSLAVVVEVFLGAGDVAGFVSIAVKPVGEDEKGGGPEAHEDAKPLGVRLLIGVVGELEPPNTDGEDDGKDACLEADGGEDAADFRIHDGS